MSGQRETESQRQVRQMVNFIMQEANEKVNEIKIKVRVFVLLFYILTFQTRRNNQDYYFL